MDDAPLIISLLGVGGGGVIITSLINGTIKWLSGSSHRERVKNTDLATQRINAITERDAAQDELNDEARKRREAEEHISILKRQLFENGITPVDRAVANKET